MTLSRKARKASNPNTTPGARHVGATAPFTVDQALSVPDGPLRNHVITYGYQCIGEALAGVLGTPSLNWCTFAAWASRTVGHVLDENELPHAIEERVASTPNAVEYGLLKLVKAGRRLVMSDQRATLVAGNTAVFDDIARRFLELIPFLKTAAAAPKGATVGQPPEDPAFARWLATMADPKNRPDLAPHLEELREGFRLYRRAASITETANGIVGVPSLESDNGVVRAELIWAANMNIGAYEQRLLQPAIEAALSDPQKAAALRGFLGEGAARAMTRLMVQYTPHGVYSVREPFPRPRFVDQGVRRGQLRTKEARLVDSAFPARPSHNPVENWTVFADRMAVIGEFFSVFHADPAFYESPFAYDDTGLDDEIRSMLEQAVARFGVGISPTSIPGFQPMTKIDRQNATALVQAIGNS
jgi:hypothetical protein